MRFGNRKMLYQYFNHLLAGVSYQLQIVGGNIFSLINYLLLSITNHFDILKTGLR